MSTTTTRVAMASARANPVASTTIAATTVAAKAYRSVSTWATAPSRLRLRRSVPAFARASSQVATRFTATPARATPSISPPPTALGVISRRTAS